MEGVSGFLKRFAYILQKKEDVLLIIKEVFQDILGVNVEKKDLKIKGTTLITNLSGGQKGQLFIFKQQLIKEINTQVGKNIITEIY